MKNNGFAKIDIGKIVKAQGIKGEVKIIPITDDVSRFNELKTVFIGQEKPMNIGFLRIEKNAVIVKFKEINDRNAAESLVGQFVSVDRKDAVRLPEGRHFIVDIVGCEVVCDGSSLGVVTDVLQYGAADVYVVNGGKIMFPLAEGVVESVDTGAGRIVVNPRRFREVAVK